MWKWDQGRIQYFQYDALRSVANFVVENDLKNSDPRLIRQKTGLEFSAPSTYSPWRNYSRIYKLCLLVSEQNGIAVPTDVAKILSQSGTVTCDEYIHFLVEATTDPAPGLSDWDKIDVQKPIRSPLCFVLKYLLAKAAGLNEYITPINEILGAYKSSGFFGGESDEQYLRLMPNRDTYPNFIGNINTRQAKESIKVISQISYLYNTGKDIVVSLNKDDAHEIFLDINPISTIRKIDGNSEILHLASLFKNGSNHDFFEYKRTVISDVIESGFKEGSKVKKTHIVIERNAKLRGRFFEKFPSAVCDACSIDTKKKYPWVKRVLDLHHILPLSSGTRVDSRGTMLDDLAPVCPTCHRAIHRFYDNYLKSNSKEDFSTQNEAQEIYVKAKKNINKDSYLV